MTRTTAIIGTVTAVLVIAAVAFRILFRVYFIPSESMEPTLPLGSHITVRLSDTAAAGDIVVFENPYPGLTFNQVSRVVAIGGQRVESVSGFVYVDGVEIDEPYLDEGTRTRLLEPVLVPDGSIYVLSDGRNNNAADSRTFGSISNGDIIGVSAYAGRWPGLVLNTATVLALIALAGSAIRDHLRPSN